MGYEYIGEGITNKEILVDIGNTLGTMGGGVSNPDIDEEPTICLLSHNTTHKYQQWVKALNVPHNSTEVAEAWVKEFVEHAKTEYMECLDGTR